MPNKTTNVRYKITPVTRYIVSRYAETIDVDGTNLAEGSICGTFEDGSTAYHVAYALCHKEHIDSGEPLESMRFEYADIPDGVSISPSL